GGYRAVPGAADRPAAVRSLGAREARVRTARNEGAGAPAAPHERALQRDEGGAARGGRALPLAAHAQMARAAGRRHYPDVALPANAELAQQALAPREPPSVLHRPALHLRIGAERLRRVVRPVRVIERLARDGDEVRAPGAQRLLGLLGAEDQADRHRLHAGLLAYALGERQLESGHPRQRELGR